MSGKQDRQKVTVETLLHLKKNERPKAEFWDSFEQDFDRRRLHALVERPSWRDIIISPAFKAFALGIPALALVALAFVWTPVESPAPSPLVLGNGTDLAENLSLPTVDIIAKAAVVPSMDMNLDTSRTSNQFVLDAIQNKSGSTARFRKVLYTPAIRLTIPSGASYVRDNLSSSNYKVTTADVKPGRNF